MKMRDLEVWGVPSYIVDIWEKDYSPHLLEVQEKAVRNYGVLDYNDKNRNLVVVAPVILVVVAPVILVVVAIVVMGDVVEEWRPGLGWGLLASM